MNQWKKGQIGEFLSAGLEWKLWSSQQQRLREIFILLHKAKCGIRDKPHGEKGRFVDLAFGECWIVNGQQYKK